MTAPHRIRLSRAKGWRMPADTVKVDRSTPWGNPFITGEHGTRERCVELYRYLLGGLLCLSTGNGDEQQACRKYVEAHYKELRGKNLACWCPRDAACHADVLLELANR
jgi:hypothetical protein